MVLRGRAHRRATDYRLLSVTLDTLPADTPFVQEEIADDYDLIIVRDGVEYGELLRAYIAGLPAWARRRIFASVCVADPVTDWSGYVRSAWWDDDWLVNPCSIRVAEAAIPGLLVPWRHSWAA